MPLSKFSSSPSSDMFAASGRVKRATSEKSSQALAPEKRKLTPDEDEAISGITRWATLKNWPAAAETRKELVKAVLRYCTNADAIRACIAHFAESQEWVPTEFDIRTAAEEHAWSASDMNRLGVLRKMAESCEFCQGSGREYVKLSRTKERWNEAAGQYEDFVEEIDALTWCRCPYGQLRRKVENAG